MAEHGPRVKPKIKPHELEGRELLDVDDVSIGRVFSCGRAKTGELLCTVDLDARFQELMGTGRTEALFDAEHVTSIEGDRVKLNMPGLEVLKG